MIQAPVQERAAFPTNQNDASSSDKSWKYNRSVTSGSTYSKNGNMYQWCDGPGHGGRGMWVAHAPGTCKVILDWLAWGHQFLDRGAQCWTQQLHGLLFGGRVLPIAPHLYLDWKHRASVNE